LIDTFFTRGQKQKGPFFKWKERKAWHRNIAQATAARHQGDLMSLRGKIAKNVAKMYA
jgi:hypothetical protein